MKNPYPYVELETIREADAAFAEIVDEMADAVADAATDHLADGYDREAAVSQALFQETPDLHAVHWDDLAPLVTVMFEIANWEDDADHVSPDTFRSPTADTMATSGVGGQVVLLVEELTRKIIAAHAYERLTADCAWDARDRISARKFIRSLEAADYVEGGKGTVAMSLENSNGIQVTRSYVFTEEGRPRQVYTGGDCPTDTTGMMEAVRRHL